MFASLIGYGIAVHFVLYSGKKHECRLVFIYGYFSAARCNGTGAVLVILDHAEQRDVYAKLPEYRLNSIDLTFAAVEEDKVGETSEAFVRFVFILVMGEASAEDLVHAGKVVLCRDILY